MSMTSVNLIPHPRRRAAAARHRARRWCWGVAGYAAVLLGAYASAAAIITAQGDDKSAMLERTMRQIEELNNAAAALKPQLSEAHTRLSVARTVGDQPDWSLLLAVISGTIDDDIVLSSTKLDTLADERSAQIAPVPQAAKRASNADANEKSLEPTMLRVTLQGIGRSQSAVTQFVLRLERLGLFERVDLARSSRQTVGAVDANVFRIECSLQRSVKPASSSSTGGRG